MQTIRKMLREYPEQKTERYLSYVQKLKTEKKRGGDLVNPWASKKPDGYWIDTFKDVADNVGLYIDGKSVSITSIGVTYDYNAYKNVLSKKYPETTYDYQLAYDVDEYVFHKKNGKIDYTHKIKDPFSTSKKIVGAYAIIKNRLGEFLEVINLDDINKFKNSSRMPHLWKNWYDRMVLKSVIKRICKSAFYDVVETMYNQDNEHSNPNNAKIESEMQEQIAACKTTEDIKKIWKDAYIKDRFLFKLFQDKKAEIVQAMKDQPQKKVVDDKQLKIAIGKIVSKELSKDEFLEYHILSDMQQTYFEEALSNV